MKRLILASGNRGKLAELRELLAPIGIECIAQGELGIADIEETGATFVENALLKARHAAHESRLPALADDSGLCVDTLGGAPGLHSARYAGAHGDSAANIAKLLGVLRGNEDDRGAHFHCSIVLLARADDPAPLIAEGRWHGRILEAPRGEKGFGYDPVFLPAGYERSAAELDTATKNRISHRGQALATLRRLLESAA